MAYAPQRVWEMVYRVLLLSEVENGWNAASGTDRSSGAGAQELQTRGLPQFRDNRFPIRKKQREGHPGQGV